MEKLNKILASWGSTRTQLVREFQEEIWNDPNCDTDPAYTVLNELAYDLDYYEPNPGLRREDRSFFGDDILRERILDAIKKLKALGKA